MNLIRDKHCLNIGYRFKFFLLYVLTIHKVFEFYFYTLLFFDKILATEVFPEDKEPVLPIFINLIWTPVVLAAHRQLLD